MGQQFPALLLTPPHSIHARCQDAHARVPPALTHLGACFARQTGTGYLVPIVRGFANNQIVGLKEVLALGRLLRECGFVWAECLHKLG